MVVGEGVKTDISSATLGCQEKCDDLTKVHSKLCALKN